MFEVVMAIKINYHNHSKNSGLGNKLFLHFLARALSLQNNEPLCNWLNTKINIGMEKIHKNVAGVKKDHWGLLWPYSSCEEKDLTILGSHNNVERFYGSDFHQSPNTVDLISKHKTQMIKDFGEEDGLFVHVRYGDLERFHNGAHVCHYEYYKQCLCNINSNKRYLASDSLSRPFVKKIMRDFDLKPYKNTPEETIIFGSKFKNKVLSLGTFSWWIGFIGSQHNVICPNPSDYRWWHGTIFECMQDWNMVSKPYEKNN